MLSAGTAFTDLSGAVLGGVVEALRAGESVFVCTDEVGAKQLKG